MTESQSILGEVNVKLLEQSRKDQENKDKREKSAKSFMDKYDLKSKEAEEILKLLEENLKYQSQDSFIKTSLKQNLITYVTAAMEDFCSNTNGSNSDEIFNQYCR